MDTPTGPSYRGYRFPREIIAHCVWLYFRFSLSFRDIQEMMLERGVEVSHEAIRRWYCQVNERAFPVSPTLMLGDRLSFALHHLADAAQNPQTVDISHSIRALRQFRR